MLKKSRSQKMSRKKPEHRRNGQDVNRRNFLRLESLEARLALTAFAMNDVFNTGIDQPLAVSSPGVLANDTGAVGMPMSATLFSGPANGQLTFNSDGSFDYVPNTGFQGMDSFVYYANDTEANSLLAAVTINVSEGSAPVSVDDIFTLNEDETLVIPGVTGVLENDSAAASATVSLISGPASGALTLDVDGGFVYTPEANFSGEVSFTYQATNSIGVGNIATVTLSIAPVNDVPVAVNDSFTMDEDGNLTSPTSVLENDTDVEGSPLTPILASQPLNGSVTFNADGTFNYAPNANFHGLDGFSYLVSDGTANSEVATVTITVNSVNDLPVGENDEYTMDEDTTLSVDASGVLANDTDSDSSSLTAELVAGPQHGTVTLNADGSFIYTPEANFSGVDGFSYHVNDGEGTSDVTSVTINVVPINDAPIASNDEYTTPEDTELVIDIPGVMSNDFDPDGDPITAQIISQPQHGTISLAADGSLVYMPAADFSGLDGFSYAVTDGTLTSEVATVTITVTPVNDAPNSEADAYTTEEDTPLIVTTGGVLDNDSDPEGSPLTASLVSGPANGTLTLNADGTFEYIPNADFSGEDSFVYTASDGEISGPEMTVTINVTPVNDGPLSEADAYTTEEDTPLIVTTGGVLDNDSDPEGAPLTASLVSGPANGTLTLNADGTFEYIPNADFSGEDSFVYTASDGEISGPEMTVTINVTPVNDGPLSEADAYTTEEDTPLIVSTGGVLDNDSDPEGASLTASLVSGPANGSLTLNADGTFEYIPNADFSGEDSFVYTASDGEMSGPETTVIITVTSANDAPISQAEAYTVEEDNPLFVSTGGVLDNDSDPEGSPLTAILVSGPANGSLTLNPDGTFEYLPNADFYGEDSFVYVASDGELSSAETTVTISVSPVNDKPFAEDDAYSTDENTPLTIDPTGVLANDSDIDGDALTASLIEGPTNGTVTLNVDGSFVYTPNPGFAGVDTFTYAAEDGSDAATAIVTITVNDVIQPPAVAEDYYNVGEDIALDISAAWGVLANDVDPQDLALTAEVITPPAHGELIMDSSGSFRYVPEANWNGVDTFTYRATNSNGDITEGIAQITVEAINDAPNAVDDSFSVAAGGTLTTDAVAGVQANDSDIDSSTLTAKLVRGPRHGTLSFNADGSFTYTPADGYIGSDEFTYQLNDGMTNSLVARATIAIGGDVGGVNAPPIAAADSYSLLQDETLTIAAPGVLANDLDVDGNPLTAQLMTNAANGMVILAADGSFVYTPNAGFVGNDSFTYAPHDGIISGDPVTVTLTVGETGETGNNTRPIAHNDHYNATIDTPLTIAASGVLANDHDAENGMLTALYFGGPQHGTVELNADGSFTYTPEPGYIGVDSFLYRVSDGSLYSPLAAVTIRVSPFQGSVIGELPEPDHSHDDGEQGAIDCLMAEGNFRFWG